MASSYERSNGREAATDRVRIPRQHGLDAVAGDLGQVGVVDAGGAEVGDVAVAALVGADVETGGFLGRLPDVAVEVALAPEAPGRRRE